MTIKELPGTTARILVSSQVLQTPSSIIKELIENSIDAHATYISVHLDPTAVGQFSIRDNGQGIPAGQDREIMCQQYTTSKLNCFEELMERKLDTLGFRGEALASLVQIAKQVEITTRTSNDAVAEKWTVLDDGSRIDVQALSASIGTTILASALFHSVPVRKNIYEKESKKIISSLKNMLTSFALLHRNLRLTFKILRSVAPTMIFEGAASLEEAVINCFGREVFQSSIFLKENFEDDLVFEAVLPLPSDETDPTTLRRAFKHVLYAVDHRLLSPSLSTAKKLAKQTRKYVQTCHNGLIMLNVKTGIERKLYDVNVEPGKDDVLFYDEQGVIDKWAEILRRVYGERIVTENGEHKEHREEAARAKVKLDGLIQDDFYKYLRPQEHVLEKKRELKQGGRDLEQAKPVLDVEPEGDDWEIPDSQEDSPLDSSEFDHSDCSDEDITANTTILNGNSDFGLSPSTSPRQALSTTHTEHEKSSPVRPIRPHPRRPRPNTNHRISTVPKEKEVWYDEGEANVEPLFISDHSPEQDRTVRLNFSTKSGTPKESNHSCTITPYLTGNSQIRSRVQLALDCISESDATFQFQVHEDSRPVLSMAAALSNSQLDPEAPPHTTESECVAVVMANLHAAVGNGHLLPTQATTLQMEILNMSLTVGEQGWLMFA
ncbi:histidine kinase-like ATPase [Lipomyces oligophaga]|uniref:histidine kinase-like ATPase n=1 Tax=Lipomyces oligophaga TaxID=45792 RepID=UPI0034CD684E